jgi:uncharacterized protein (TIGR03086 family)
VNARIDPATFDCLATDSTRARLTGLSVADLDRPASTTDWDIRTLLSHLVGGNIRFAQALRGDAVDWPTRDSEPVATPLAEFDATSADLAATIGGLSDPKQPVRLAAGEPPAFFAIGVHAADMLIHGWDLAVATGQDATLDDDLCLAAIAVLERYPASFWGPGQFFAPRVETTSSDPAVRLLGLAGRVAAR